MAPAFDAFGLGVNSANGGLDLHASASNHRWGRVIPGRHKRLGYLSFNCTEEHLAVR